MAGQVLEVRCPRCQWFVLRIETREAAFEVNCPSTRCQTTIMASVQDGRIAVEATPKKKKA